MWMYKHWRHLPGTEVDPRYPDYANQTASSARCWPLQKAGAASEAAPKRHGSMETPDPVSC